MERAIAADGNFTNSVACSSQSLQIQGRPDDAKRQLEAVLHADESPLPFCLGLM